MRINQVFFVFVILFVLGACQINLKNDKNDKLGNDLKGGINNKSHIPFDSTLIEPFFLNYSDLAKYEADVKQIYRRHQFNYIWFDKDGLIEFANALYSKLKNLEAEGLSGDYPYIEKIEGIFVEESENLLNRTDTELMLSSMFLFYSEKVYKGIDESTSKALEWLLPRKQVNYVDLLDSVVNKPNSLDNNQKVLFAQYYLLRDALLRFRELEKAGGWQSIPYNPKMKSIKIGETSDLIVQIRNRLRVTGELISKDSSRRYDTELFVAVKKFQKNNGRQPDGVIGQKFLADVNVSVTDLIKRIMVNMERFRWISPDLVKSDELIFVNIPSYELLYYRNGEIVLESPVVVGKTMSKTVIFSGKLSNIVFSPYWNLPESIVKKEVKPGLAKDPNYLEKHNMERYNGLIRQKPGPSNSLGLVKFIFPNSNDIYLHDTPSKSYFSRDNRAASHGCVRVEKPRELALEILRSDTLWTPAKVDAAMHGGKEKWYGLKNKVPVFIGYFTAWVDREGKINFFEDIYKLDDRLAEMIMN